MTQTNNEMVDANADEISIKELILKIKGITTYLLSKWVIILIALIVGYAIGMAYSLMRKPVYKAELSFALQDEKSGGNISSALGLASQFGIDVGGANAGGEFSGDNLLELMKSRSMIEKAFLTTVVINNKEQTLVNLYIDFNKYRERWGGTYAEKVNFKPNDIDRTKFTLTQDSVLRILYKEILKKNLTVDKIDKKLSIISLTVESTNELFSKYFVESLTKVVSDFYIQTKTKKGAKNVAILQSQTDSIRRLLGSGLSAVASSIDANPNSNPLLRTLNVPSQRKSIDVQANTGILSELIKNLGVAKLSLLQETPLIQIIDRPILPLENDKIKPLKGAVIGALLGTITTVIFLVLIAVFKTVMNK